MPGQATVTIGERQWTVSVATTPAELTAGLSGIASIPAGTGILFDMGVDRSSIPVNMSEMLFALDIIFINSSVGVVGVLHDVQPGDEALFQADTVAGARYFLEVNAGEAEDIEVGDTVDLGGEVQPTFWAAIITAVMSISKIAIVGAVTYRVVKGELTKAKEGRE